MGERKVSQSVNQSVSNSQARDGCVRVCEGVRRRVREGEPASSAASLPHFFSLAS